MPDALPDAVVAVVRWGERFLAIQRAAHIPGGGFWAPPSGKLEPGETQAEAVAREVWEETGLVVSPVRKVWECLSSSGTYRLHWWLADYVSGELRPDPAEVSACRWLTVAEFRALERTFAGDLEFFDRVWPGL